MRLIVCAADNCSKLVLNCTNGDENERELAINLVKLVLVSESVKLFLMIVILYVSFVFRHGK